MRAIEYTRLRGIAAGISLVGFARRREQRFDAQVGPAVQHVASRVEPGLHTRSRGAAALQTAALRPVVAAIAGARATQQAVRSNLVRALVYNVLAVTAAVFGLINPLVAAILMPLSSGWVVLGALRVDRRIQRLEDQWTS